ncbi:BsaWI family type II restriction enzyme [Algoriphagus aquimarinus]|uniref:BsaWI family type II restriction enzyme n=1 Tax=Algoriphagus aquimarinus TaxID=237018 RepID=UPI0030D72CC7|tara:strand:- start:9665 stop:10540 length:876 start_codon:yes stop_codon:yes gene_type:complete
MLSDILNFKAALRLHFLKVTPSIDEYENGIKVILGTQQMDFSNSNSHWRNYLHASLLSLYLELKGYDLEVWNEYAGNRTSLGKLFGFDSSAEDKILELFVLHSINHVFDFGTNEFSIVALKANNPSKPTFLTDDSNQRHFLTIPENQRLLENLKISMKIRGVPKKDIWGDNDVIVALKHHNIIQQFCIISCKLSLRERVYQSVFWSMHSRLESIGRHVFVTIDKGTKGSVSEIGHRNIDNSARKTRDVLESTMDRVYVLRKDSEVGRSQVIKDFLHMQNDLQLWAQEFTGS